MATAKTVPSPYKPFNYDASAIVKKAYEQYTGKEAPATLDLSDVVDGGVEGIDHIPREQFTKALIAATTKTHFLDIVQYVAGDTDVFYEDSARFGAIMQAVSVEAPEVIANSSMKEFQSGVTTVGQYTVYLPIIENTLFVRSESWAVPITITGKQWDSAVKSEEGLNELIAVILMAVENKVAIHLETMDMANRNNFMAAKFDFHHNHGDTGVQVVNLVEVYAKANGNTAMKAADYMASKEAVTDGVRVMKQYSKYMQKPSRNFNTKSALKFTPPNRLVCQILSEFASKAETVAVANTYWKDLVDLPLYREVPFWQACDKYDFSSTSKIDVTIRKEDGSENTQSRTGIVGLLVDKWAIMHTIVQDRVGAQHFDIEDLSHYEYQHQDKLCNLLMQNGVVFYVSDYSPA